MDSARLLIDPKASSTREVLRIVTGGSVLKEG
jgi:hypothetical protein